jgi:hypothetical protein
MPFTYRSGEQVLEGDRVSYAGKAGVVEEIADPMKHPDHWIVQEYEGGVMIVEVNPTLFGRVLLTNTRDDEDLIFVSRAKVRHV